MIYVTIKSDTVFTLKHLVRTGWTIATLIWLIAVSGLPSDLNESKASVIDSFFRVSYGALHRSAWAVAVGWLIFACIHDYGGNLFYS